MSKRTKSRPPRHGSKPRGTSFAPKAVIAGLLITGAIVAVLALRRGPTAAGSASTALASSNSPKPIAPLAPSAPSAPASELPRMEVKQAVMVTVDLDFGGPIPSVADALKQIERRHQPSDGTGRVFSIIDAYQSPGAAENKLRLSMHVSAEKTGIGSMVFRRTGEVLWSNRVIPAPDGTASAQPEGLTILIDNRKGGVFIVDGSANPETILQAKLKEPGTFVAEAWPDGDEREITFLYSACGCPVKVVCRRQGNRTVRTRDEPVIFPDDPVAVEIIQRLMAW